MFSFFPKNDHEQTVRIKRFLMALASYFMWCSIFFYIFLLGLTAVPLSVLFVCFSGFIVYNVSLYAIIRTGFNKRFKDPSLTLFQMIVATLWTMMFLYYADSARSVVLLLYLVVFVFGLFRLKVREFLFLSVFAVVNYAAIILLLYKFRPESINKKIDLLNIMILIMVLPWFSLLGGYITKLRAKISNAFSTIEKMTDNIQDVIFNMDMNLNYTYVSPSVKNLRGYEPEEVLKQAPFDALTPSSLDLGMRTLSEVMEQEKLGHNVPISRTLQLEVRRKDGTTVWTETKFTFIRDKNQRPVGVLGVMRDITERKQAESQREAALEKLRESEANYRQLFDNSPAGIYQIDFKNGRFLKANDLICEYIGCGQEEITSLSPYDFLTEESKKLLLERLEKMAQGVKVPETVEYEIFDKKGKRWYLQLHSKNIYDAEGHVVAADVVAHDITERKQAEDALRESKQRYLELSIIDDLTQLYNSRNFYSQLEREMERSNRYEQPLTLLLFDLDKFKDFNDTYGHVEGDQVLLRLGQVIKRCLRETDSAYRYGGEEFTIMLPMTTSEEGMVTAKRIQTELRKEAFSPMLGQEVYVTVSIGLAQYKPKEEMKAFVNRVDQLMYHAKKNGRDRISPES